MLVNKKARFRSNERWKSFKQEPVIHAPSCKQSNDLQSKTPEYKSHMFFAEIEKEEMKKGESEK